MENIQFSIPLIVTYANNVTNECFDTMHELCKQPFNLECKSSNEFSITCHNNYVAPPTAMRVHPILCKSLNEFYSYRKIFNSEKYHNFLQSYISLVFIDYKITKNTAKVQKQFLEFGDEKDNIIFVLFNSSEEQIKEHNEKTCLCFDTFSLGVSVPCVQEFISRNVSDSLAKTIHFMDGEDLNARINNIKCKANILGTSCNPRETIKIIKQGLKEIEDDSKGNNYFGYLGCFYEMASLLEKSDKGLCKLAKIPLSVNLQLPFKSIPPSFSNLDSLKKCYKCLLIALNYYGKANEIDKVIDCGVRFIANGFIDVIQPIVEYINENLNFENISIRSWFLISCIINMGMKKKAALTASIFAKSFPNDINFIVLSLELIVSEASKSGLVQLRDLCIPMLISLLKEKSKISELALSRILSKILGTIGPSLPRKTQKLLFNELYTNEEIELPITVGQVSFQYQPFNIIKNSQVKSSGVFLYSYLPGKKKQVNDITIAIHQSNSIAIEIFNPFSITLKAESIKLIVSDESVKCQKSQRSFLPNSKTLIYCHFLPKQNSDFKILGISMTLYGGKQHIKISNNTVYHAVDKVPHFTLQTDLPISSKLSLYNGEISEFNLWLTNTSSVPISNVFIKFQQPESAKIINNPVYPLKPNEKIQIKCSFIAEKGDEYLAAQIISTYENGEYQCTQNIRQYLDIFDGLSVERLFLVKPPVLELSKDSINTIKVGYEIRNLSNCSFMYRSKINGIESEGLIGHQESLLIISTNLVSELKTDGHDANKNRIIAMTKQKEQEIGKSLTQAQRHHISKIVSIMQKLESKWEFYWRVTSSRKGILESRFAKIDDELISGIEDQQIGISITWKFEGEQVETLFSEKIYELNIDFGEKIYECSLEFLEDNEFNQGILWEGELTQKSEEGKSSYHYIICFGDVGEFKIKFKYVSENGVNHCQFKVNVNE